MAYLGIEDNMVNNSLLQDRLNVLKKKSAKASTQYDKDDIQVVKLDEKIDDSGSVLTNWHVGILKLILYCVNVSLN